MAFDSKFFLDKIAPLYLMSVPTERLVFSVIGFKPGFESSLGARRLHGYAGIVFRACQRVEATGEGGLSKWRQEK